MASVRWTVMPLIPSSKPCCQDSGPGVSQHLIEYTSQRTKLRDTSFKEGRPLQNYATCYQCPRDKFNQPSLPIFAARVFGAIIGACARRAVPKSGGLLHPWLTLVLGAIPGCLERHEPHPSLAAHPDAAHQAHPGQGKLRRASRQLSSVRVLDPPRSRLVSGAPRKWRSPGPRSRGQSTRLRCVSDIPARGPRPASITLAHSQAPVTRPSGGGGGGGGGCSALMLEYLALRPGSSGRSEFTGVFMGWVRRRDRHAPSVCVRITYA